VANLGPPDAMPVLTALGWKWYEDGAMVRTVVDGTEHQVWIPLRFIWSLFHGELQACGCPIAQEIGAPMTVGGFFSSIKRAVKRGYRKAKKAARKVVRKAVPKRLRKAARKVYNLAKRIARGAYKIVTTREAQAVVAALGVAIPALAPAAAAVVAAQEGLRYLDRGAKAAKAIARGAKATPKLVAAMRKAKRTKAEFDRRAQQAKAGSRSAQEFVGALAQLAK